jgi:hypothetical protein
VTVGADVGSVVYVLVGIFVIGAAEGVRKELGFVLGEDDFTLEGARDGIDETDGADEIEGARDGIEETVGADDIEGACDGKANPR